MKRQDCGREDECLAQLAKLAGTLYGLYVQLDFDSAGQVIASGRVVRDDGVAMGKAATVKVVKGASPFKDVARDALNQLFLGLGVKALSPFRLKVDAPVVAPPVAKVEPAPEVAPKVGAAVGPGVGVVVAPPVVTDEGAGKRASGKLVLGAGLAAVAVGGLVLGLGVAQAGGLTPDRGSLPPGQLETYKTSRLLTVTGAVVTGVGAVAAGVGAMMLATAPAAPVQVGVVPVGGGAVFSLSGVY